MLTMHDIISDENNFFKFVLQSEGLVKVDGSSVFEEALQNINEELKLDFNVRLIINKKFESYEQA